MIDGTSGYKEFAFNASGIAKLEALFGTSGGNGFLLLGDEALGASTEFRSSEHATDGTRPYLQVEYEVAGAFIPRIMVI